MKGLAIALVLGSATALAQPSRVADLNTEPTLLSSAPHAFASTPTGSVFFLATDRRGTELWRSDGTAAGTVLSTESVPGESSDPWAPALRFPGGLVWQSTGLTVVTDGTAAGTWTLPAAACPQLLGLTQNRLLCGVNLGDGGVGLEALRPDGGVTMVGAGYGSLAALGILDGGLVLAASVGTDAGLLWTNGLGTSALTRSASTFHPNLPSATTGASPFLPVTATLAGTTALVALTGGPAAPTVTVLRPSVFFTALNFTQPWLGGTVFSQEDPNYYGTGRQAFTWSDGTLASVTVVPSYFFSNSCSPIVANGRLCFAEPFNQWTIVECRTSVATYGIAGPVRNVPFLALFALNGRFYGLDPTSVYDLGPDGLQLNYLGPAAGAALNDVATLAQPERALFASSSGPPQQGLELQVTDGTVAGTGVPLDLWSATASFDPSAAQLDGDGVLLAGALDAGDALCRVPATGSPTCVTATGLRRRAGPVLSSAGWLLPAAGPNGVVLTLALTDGGWAPLAADDAGLPLSGLSVPVALPGGLLPAGSLLVAAGHPLYGRELFVTGGTAQSTELLADLAPGTASSSPSSLVVNGAAAYFSADDGTGRGPWVTFGTAAGTRSLATAANGLTGSSPSHFVPVGTQVVFSATTPAGGEELFVSNGTAAGTRPLAEAVAGPGSASLVALGSAGGVVVATGYVEDAGDELFLVPLDGGAVRWLDLSLDGGSAPTAIGPCDGGFLFAADDGVRGREPWVTDGTPAGTHLVQDLLPGPLGSSPGAGLVVHGRVFFAATGLTTGRELYVSDGTTGGVQLAGEVTVGALSSNPDQLAWVGSRLYFTATDQAGDREGYSVALPPGDDSTPPRVEGHLTGPLTGTGWYVGDVTGSFTVIEPDGPVVTAGCDGGVFSQDTLGTTQTCVATSAGGQAQVTLSWKKDSTAPVLNCPAPIAAQATDAGTAVVEYAVDVHDAIDPSPTVTVSVPSGASLGIGRTPVTVLADDAAGNRSTCSFEITVTAAPPEDSTLPPPAPPRKPCGCTAVDAPVGLLAAAVLWRRRRSLTPRAATAPGSRCSP